VDPAAEISKFALLRKNEAMSEKQQKMFFICFLGVRLEIYFKKLGLYGGLYIAGGIAPRILPLLEDDVYFSRGFR
jgi:glucokinase